MFDGAGSLEATLVGGAGKIAEIDASAMKGSLELDIATAELNTTKAVIKGGTATDDVLGVTGHINAKMTISGFETVGTNGGDSNFDMTNVTGATTVANFSANPDGPTAGGLTVTKATGETNLLMEGLGEADKVNTNMTIGGINFEAAGATAQAALAVAINNDGVALGMATATTEAKINAHALTIKNVKDITIAAADADVVLGGLVANKMESLTVTAAEDFAITGNVTFSNAAKVDMTGVKGDVTMTTGAMTTALTYTGSSAVDTLTFGALTGGTALDFKIDTGAGNDSVILGSTLGANTAAKLNLTLGEGDDTLTVGAAAITADHGKDQTIDFGAGTDTLVFTSAANVDLSKANVTGLDKIVLNAGAANLTINDTTADTVKAVTHLGTGTLTVQMTDKTYDATGMTINGAAGSKFAIIGTEFNDEIHANAFGGTITGGADADKITLGTGVDTVKFEATAAGNGVDTITGFTGGAGKDVLDFTAFLGGASADTLNPLKANPGGSSTVADKVVSILVDIAGNQDLSTAEGLTTALASTGEYKNVDATEAGTTKYIFLTAASDTATTYNVFYAESAAGSTDFSGIELVGTIATDKIYTALHTENFA